jgi:hypothetical protein
VDLGSDGAGTDEEGSKEDDEDVGDKYSDGREGEEAQEGKLERWDKR